MDGVSYAEQGSDHCPVGLGGVGLKKFTPVHCDTLLLDTSAGSVAKTAITANIALLRVPVLAAFYGTRLAAVVLLAKPIACWFL